MKYVLLMGRGIEGTGNTKYAVEFQEFLEKQGHYVVTLANSDKKWGREKSHPNKIRLVSYAYNDREIYEICKGADCVFVLSVPASNYPWESQDSFYNIICDLYDKGTKLVYIQVDHKMQSIKRNFYVDLMYTDVLEKFNVIFTHSPRCDFLRFCNENWLKLKSVICATDLGTGTINGFNFNKYLPFWTTEKDYKVIRFMGRSANWKGPWLVRDLHMQHFKNQGYITILEGIEGSIGTVAELYKETKPERIPRDDVIIRLKTSDKNALNEGKMTFDYGEPTYVLPPYDNVDGMKRLAQSMFGVELLLLNDEVLSDICEYAMMEIVAVGTIPVFRKKWGDLFKVNGKSLTEYDTGIIFMDEKEPSDAIRKMNELADDKERYYAERDKVFDFFRTYFDSNVIFNKIMEYVNGN